MTENKKNKKNKKANFHIYLDTEVGEKFIKLANSKGFKAGQYARYLIYKEMNLIN
jgi:hypothetical protein